MHPELVIAGGGIIGLYTAHVLAERGINSTIIERGSIGRESSWAAGGILTSLLPWQYEHTVNSLTQNAAKDYGDLANRLLQETGIDVEHWSCGLTALNVEDLSAAEHWCMQNKLTYSNEPHVRAHLRPEPLRPCLYLPGIAQIRTPALINSLVASLTSRGVKLMPETEVLECKITNGQIVGLVTTRGQFATENLVWATGAWTQQLQCSEQTIVTPPVVPIRGQMLAFDGKNIGLTTIIFDNGHYLIPRKDGLILAGSTLEDVGFDKSVTKKALDELREKSVHLLPSLKHCDVTQHWSGLRPGSIDNVPTIGPDPQIQGLYYNCGHFRYGVAMAPKSAEMIADWILRSDKEVQNTTYLPKAVSNP